MKDLGKSFPLRRKGFFWVLWSLFLCTLVLWSTLPAPLHGASVTAGAQRHQLANGLTVIVKEDHSSPVASIQVWVKTGSANETAREAGITHFIEHMIFKGTPTRKTGEIAKVIESSGGSINAYTTLDRTVYYVEIPSRHLRTGLDVLLDAVQHAVFDPDELKREKEVVLEEYRRSLDIPRTQLVWELMDLAYEKHPYGRPVIGYDDTIRSFDQNAVLQYIEKWYAPHNVTVVAVGDFDADAALAAVQELTQDFPKRTPQEPFREAEPAQHQLRNTVLTGKVQQVYLDMAFHIPPLTHPDMPALDILEIIMGHGKSCRLYHRLKMKENLVHSVHSGAYALSDPGLFFVDATLSPENLRPALRAIAQEIQRLASEPVHESEIAKAQRIAEADFLFDLESMAGQASNLGFFETMTGDMYQTDTYLVRLSQVTASDVQRVASAYLRPENLSVGILAPEASPASVSRQELVDLFSQTSASPLAETPAPGPYGLQASKPLLTTLPNGMRLIVKEDHRLPLVSLVGAFMGGIRLEPEGRWGISNFSAKMLTRGTVQRTATEIAATVESWAGKLDAFSGRNSIGISATFLSKDFYPGLELVADLLRNPAFPETEMEKVRMDILAGIRAKKDRPSPQLFDLFYETLYTTHPYKHPSTGTEETITGISRSQVAEWYGSLAGPANLVLAVVGDVSPDQVVPMVKGLFWGPEEWPRQIPTTPSEPPLENSRAAHLERPGAQTHLIVGFLGADLKSDANAPMALIDTALSGMGGRLFYELRDKLSLAYSVTAFRQPGLDTGAFGVYIACDPSKVSSAREAIFRELEKIRQEGLTQQELQEAKNYLLGTMLIGLQTNGEQAMHMALDELYGLGYDHIHRYMAAIEAVTAEDIQSAAARFILPNRYVFVTVGPGDAGAQ